MPTFPATGFRYYSTIPKTAAQSPLVSFGYIYDTTGVWQQQDGTLVTGGARPIIQSDLGTTSNVQLNVSGLNLTVGAVSITGFNSGSALGNLDITRTYLPTSGVGTTQVNVTNTAPLNVTGIINTVVTGAVSANVTSVAVTGGVSGSAQGNLDLTRSYLPVSGINFSTSVSVAAVAITGTNSGSALGNLDVTRTFLPVSGLQGVGIIGIDTGIRAVTITNTAPIAFSGVVLTTTTGSFSATVDNTLLIAAVASGNALLVQGNQLGSGISGLLGSNLSSAAWVTGSGTQLGNLDLTRSYLPVSGLNFSASVSVSAVAITGVATDQITGFNTGIIVTFAPVSKTVSSNSTPSGVAPFIGATIQTGQILALNATRTMFFIQNIHTGTPLYVNFGSQAASTGSFSFILNPSATPGFGGSSFSDDHYRGPITVSGGAWTAWEL